ncbi:hypothetical protein WJX72_004211 [[Myrmecia] bisecta]|uniref:EF-hand domain-containing protein n=1 Tax=[Myrmecia] bisecta TaxID=41462 RepID=A0AAW1QQT1_9CHLO
MGAQNSNLRRCIEDEFQRLAPEGRSHLVLRQIVQLHLPPSMWVVDTCHLGVLFVLDNDHDGRFTLEELLMLVDLARQRSRRYQPHEFQSQMQGFCTLQLWRAMAVTGGKAAFVDWMSQLLLENMEAQTFTQYPGHTYLNRDTIETLHHVLSIQETQGMDFQTFFDLLQRVGEERGLMELGNEELDDWLPLEVVREFLNSMNAGMLKVMADIYPSTDAALIV